MTDKDEMFQFFMRFYQKGEIENPRFFRRLGNPDIRGKHILEFGCGVGSLSVYMLEKLGAASVYAIDIEKANIEFAQANLKINHPDLIGRLDYSSIPVAQVIKPGGFDLIVTKDVLEHVIQLEECFQELVRLLKPGGSIFAGWGPIYYGPFGGHSLTKIPYDHLILPDSMLISRYNRHSQNKRLSVYDYGLNKLRISDYLKAFEKCGLKIESVHFNVNDNPLISLVGRTLGHLPFIGDLFVHSIYAKMTKEKSE